MKYLIEILAAISLVAFMVMLSMGIIGASLSKLRGVRHHRIFLEENNEENSPFYKGSQRASEHLREQFSFSARLPETG